VEKLRSSGVSLRKPGPNCKDLIRWKGIIVILKSAGLFLQSGGGGAWVDRYALV
jgi:hypothetical protein